MALGTNYSISSGKPLANSESHSSQIKTGDSNKFNQAVNDKNIISDYKNLFRGDDNLSNNPGANEHSLTLEHAKDFSSTADKILPGIKDFSDASDKLLPKTKGFGGVSDRILPEIKDFGDIADKVIPEIEDSDNASDKAISEIKDFSNSANKVLSGSESFDRSADSKIIPEVNDSGDTADKNHDTKTDSKLEFTETQLTSDTDNSDSPAVETGSAAFIENLLQHIEEFSIPVSLSNIIGGTFSNDESDSDIVKFLSSHLATAEAG